MPQGFSGAVMGLRDVQASGSPLLVRRGGCAIKKNAAKPPYSAQTGWSLTNHVPRMHSATWLESDHRSLFRPIGLTFAPLMPVRAFQRNGTILLMARPPLLTRRGLLLACNIFIARLPARRKNLVA